MDVYQEYKGKCCTADQAVQVVKDGDWVDYGMSCAYPTALDKALARRQGDLKDIKVRNAISCHPVAILEADPENETFTYNLWHCSAIDRKYLDAGRAYHEPMLFRDCGSYYTRGFAPVNVAMITVAPMDRHGNFSFGLTNGCTQEMLDAAETIIVEVNPNMPVVLAWAATTSTFRKSMPSSKARKRSAWRRIGNRVSSTSRSPRIFSPTCTTALPCSSVSAACPMPWVSSLPNRT